MGGCVASSVHSGESTLQFSKPFRCIIRRYMPHFCFGESSTDDDRLIAFSHWEHVFKETIHSTALGADSPVGRLYECFYTQLYERAPHLKALFKGNSQTQARVLVHISTGMKSLLQSENLVQKVTELALLHMKIGVQPEDFDPLGETLVQAMKLTSGDQWSDRIELAWRRIYCHAAIMILVTIPNLHLDIRDSHNELVT
jgi:hemoglobin-like flavoprotein